MQGNCWRVVTSTMTKPSSPFTSTPINSLDHSELRTNLRKTRNGRIYWRIYYASSCDTIKAVLNDTCLIHAMYLPHCQSFQWGWWWPEGSQDTVVRHLPHLGRSLLLVQQLDEWHERWHHRWPVRSVASYLMPHWRFPKRLLESAAIIHVGENSQGT